MTERFDAADYENAVARAIMRAIGAEGARLTRRQVELAYPLFRGRYWTAREVPLNQGFGVYLTPFMEPAVIKGTPDWKIAWKSHGLIEAAMIERLAPRLAASDRKSGVEGKGVSVRVDVGGGRILKKKQKQQN